MARPSPSLCPLLVSLLFPLLLLSLGCVEVAAISEASVVERTTFERLSTSLVYVYVTNRPAACTIHPINATNCAAATTNVTNPASEVHLKAIFFPKVDVMTMLKIDNTSDYFNQGVMDLEVYLEMGTGNQTIQSTRRRYINGSFLVGAWSAFAQMEDGTVTKLLWAGGCEECSNAEQCIDNTCGISVAENCSETASTPVCDMKVYFGWRGRDSSGWPSTSVGELPAYYRLLTWGNVFEQASLISQGEFNF
eukprot:TRINITY_DN1045_c0_g1_i1.p2 TRINITY_DN1045_c0_g1~~TRINITY_DN1045_c0_g1_i1.p2  ORF type:complete len:250 (-),score=33.15 TRINITY_DN1045_c0_g1_i1:70-819(-)